MRGFGLQNASVVLQPVLREIVLAKQVDVSPCHERLERDHFQDFVSLFRRFGGFHQATQVEVVPADDAVLHQAVAALGDLLVLLVGMFETAWVSDRDSPGEAAREPGLVELPSVPEFPKHAAVLVDCGMDLRKGHQAAL